MIICPNCGFKNENFSTMCVVCYNNLEEIIHSEITIMNDDLGQKLIDTSESNIFKLNEKFLIVKEINNHKINFGNFDSLDVSIIKRDELINDGWPIPSNLFDDDNEEEISKYLFKKGDKFFVAKFINGERKIFGYYSSKKEALSVKYDLIKNNWKQVKDKSKQSKLTSKYGTNVYKSRSGDSFFIRKSLGGKNFNFGYFDSLDDALFIKKLLIENGWDLTKFSNTDCIYSNNGLFYVVVILRNKLKILDKFSSFSEASKYINSDSFNGGLEKPNNIHQNNKNRYIVKNKNKFNIFKRINGELINFGVYSTREDALKARDILIKNNWKVYSTDKESLFSQDFISDNLMNKIIFNLTPWQKIIFDMINNFEEYKFTKMDIIKYSANFKRFRSSKLDMDSKLIKILEELIDLNLLKKEKENVYVKLWD